MSALAQLEALAAALSRWGSLVDAVETFGAGPAARAQLLEAHAAVRSAFGALPDEVHRAHPELREHFASLRDDPHGDRAGRLSDAVRACLLEARAGRA